MKQKILYMLVIFFSLSVFSSAKQNKNNCGKETTCCASKQKTKSKESNISEKGFELMPLQLLSFGI